ncbi:MAG: DinB family protein [Balneola sp.]|nr:MAG: DinB family protein [Balneola sp.]
MPMKYLNHFIIAISSLAILLSAYSVYEPSDKEEKSYEYLNQELENAKSFTLEVMEAMPEENYGYKPGEEMRTFRAQGFHIAYSLEWFTAQIKREPIPWEPGDEDRLSKEELIEYTAAQFDDFISFIQGAEENGQLTAAVLRTLRHNSHHRGQMVAYFRANGMAPPAYR